MNDVFRRLCESAPHLSVSIASADPLHLHDELETLAAAGVQMIHVDVMDGLFCPPATTAAPSLARAISPDFIVDVHLMVDDPLLHVQAWADAGAGIVTFQVETARHPHRVLQSMTDSKIVRGVALTPSSPVSLVEPLIDELELVLLLAVNPGWSGQRFLPGTTARLLEVRELIGDREVLLGVDGAIGRDGLAAQLTEAGLDLIVSGSAVFDGDPLANAQTMLKQMRKRPAPRSMTPPQRRQTRR